IGRSEYQLWAWSPFAFEHNPTWEGGDLPTLIERLTEQGNNHFLLQIHSRVDNFPSPTGVQPFTARWQGIEHSYLNGSRLDVERSYSKLSALDQALRAVLRDRPASECLSGKVVRTRRMGYANPT